MDVINETPSTTNLAETTGSVNCGENTEGIRDEKGRIKPGHTLNPGGRPRKKKLEDYYSEEELESLILRIKEDALTKGDIMKLVTEQIFGKAMQPTEVSGKDGEPIKLEISEQVANKRKLYAINSDTE